MNALHLATLGAVIGAAVLGAAPVPAAAPAAEVAATLARHGIQEDATPIRANPLWRKPRKVLVLGYGTRVGSTEDIRAIAGDANCHRCQ